MKSEEEHYFMNGPSHRFDNNPFDDKKSNLSVNDEMEHHKIGPFNFASEIEEPSK